MCRYYHNTLIMTESGNHKTYHAEILCEFQECQRKLCYVADSAVYKLLGGRKEQIACINCVT
jgi:hypothetical protein